MKQHSGWVYGQLHHWHIAMQGESIIYMQSALILCNMDCDIIFGVRSNLGHILYNQH